MKISLGYFKIDEWVRVNFHIFNGVIFKYSLSNEVTVYPVGWKIGPFLVNFPVGWPVGWVPLGHRDGGV